MKKLKTFLSNFQNLQQKYFEIFGNYLKISLILVKIYLKIKIKFKKPVKVFEFM